MAPLEIMGRLDLASDFTTAVDFSSKLPSSPVGGLTRAWPPAKAEQVADDCGPTLTKAELAELMFEHVGLNKREAKDMVEAFFAEISDALERGDSVKLTGFGNFRLRDKISRPGRNPKTGVVVNIPARRVVTFHASPKLKTATDESAMSAIPEDVNVEIRA
ncbi:integration host factor subunit alpha [Massilia sp. PWRC2]|uniref:integration host factor subunit alpha n=1 Tax=Massilia sp. PWRC2 TaxID=2804626 RepID=UPI003CE7FC26